MATAEGRKQNGLTSLLQVLVPWVQRTLVEQYGADWVRNPGISAALGARGFSSPVDADKYIRSQTLQAIMVLWNPVFSRVLQPSDLDLIRQLHAAERAHFDDARVDALLDGMATLVTHAGMPNEAVRFQRLKKDAGLSSLSKVEGAAMIGGILAAGYLLYEGARSLMQSDDQGDSNDNNINNNNNNNNNNMNNNDNINNNNDNNSNYTSIDNVRNIDNINNNPPVNTNVNNDIAMAENSGNVDINNENINNNNNSNENININNNTDNSVADEDAESPFVCPITLQIMKDPVITPQGICFERQAIVDWIEKAHTCPITQKPLAVDQLITCYALRAAIEEYQKLRNSKGVVSPQINNGNAQQPVPAPVPSSSSSNPVSRVQRAVHHAVADRPHINVDVAPRFRGQVKCLTAAQLRSEDTFTHYPEASKYITFPASTNFLVSRSTGYVVIENRGNFEVTLISRQREGNLWEPGNEGGRLCGSYSLGPHQEQGFDYRGWYCIEVPPDLNNRPIDLLVTDFSLKGGGKGAWLRMGTGGPEFKE